MTIGDKVVHAVRQQQPLIQFKGSLPRPMTLQRLGVKPRQFPLIQGAFLKTHNNFTAGPVNDVKLPLIKRIFSKTHDAYCLFHSLSVQFSLIQGVFSKTHDTPGRLPRSSICYPLRGLFQDP